VELVEGDLGLGKVIGDALDEGGTHVDAHLLDVAGIAVVGFEIVGELTNRVCATSLGHEHDAALVDIDEQRDVVVTALGSSLVALGCRTMASAATISLRCRMAPARKACVGASTRS
jgi:hypothetical protein